MNYRKIILKTKVLAIISFLAVFHSPVYGQIVSKTINLNFTQNTIKKNIVTNVHSSESGSYEIGRTTETSQAVVYRTYFAFDISEISQSNSPTITNIRVHYDIGTNSSAKFKITGPNTVTDGSTPENLTSN